MPQVNNDLLPGLQGKDYHYVRYGGKVYVVYAVTLPNGTKTQMSWRVSDKDFKALGINQQKVNQISKGQFQNLNFFGDSSEIARAGDDVHPFQQYLKKLRELHGPVSWMEDKDFMGVMLMGWAENWTAEELRQRLTRTDWYKSRTDYQRQYEMDMAPADREAQSKLWGTRAGDALRDDILGAGFNLQDLGMNQKDLDEAVKKISSGVWGDPTSGFEVWLSSMRDKAERIEGTAAWQERQRKLEEDRAFMNRPEDMYEKIRGEALEWLGPRGLPDDETLKSWSERLVSERASDGDWQQYLRGQAKSLYPYLGNDERWTDRAASYKRIVEENFAKPIDWNHALLQNIGETGQDGNFTGKAMAYDDFEKLVRQQDQFYQGPVARDEGFQLFNFLNEQFRGVTA